MMSVADRIGRSLFVALAVGLAWGIRGDFGHLVGAMYPGAVLAMALAYVSGQRSLFLWMPVLAGVSALAIGSGGMCSGWLVTTSRLDCVAPSSATSASGWGWRPAGCWATLPTCCRQNTASRLTTGT